MIVIHSEKSRDIAAERLKSLPEGWAVDFIEPKAVRTREQNKLYWKWLSIISDETGYTKDELHDMFACKFLGYNVYRFRGDGDYEGIARMLNVDVEDLGAIIKVRTTTKLTTKEFTEYLESIYLEVSQMGIVLPHPDDRGREW